MTGNLKTAFDSIRAEEKLKANVMQYLQNEIRRQNGARVRSSVRRFAAVFASVAVLILSSVFSYNLYFTPSAYVDVDVNPSVELALNKFDRVIDATAYNEDGERILSGLSIKHKNYEDALIIMIDTINKNGYIQNDGFVSVTLQTDNLGKEATLLAGIQAGVTDYMSVHHHETQVDVFSVSGDVQTYAHELNISPAKYLAIQELIEVDPTATVESHRGHSISEIRQLTHEHIHDSGQGDSHHGESSESGHHG